MSPDFSKCLDFYDPASLFLYQPLDNPPQAAQTLLPVLHPSRVPYSPPSQFRLSIPRSPHLHVFPALPPYCCLAQDCPPSPNRASYYFHRMYHLLPLLLECSRHYVIHLVSGVKYLQFRISRQCYFLKFSRIFFASPFAIRTSQWQHR